MQFRLSFLRMASLVVFFFVNMANASEKPLILSYCVEQCKTEAQLQHTIRLSHGHEADILLVDPETNTTHHLRTIKQSEESHALTLKAEYQKSFDGVLSQQLTNRLALYLNRFETMLNENGSDLNKSKYGYPIYSLHDFLTAEESAHFRIQDNYFTKTESIYTNELNDRYASLIEQQDAEFNRLLVDEFGERPMAIDPLLQLYVINELTVILVEKPGDPYGIKATLRTNGKHIIVDFETLVLMRTKTISQNWKCLYPIGFTRKSTTIGRLSALLQSVTSRSCASSDFQFSMKMGAVTPANLFMSKT